jgi:branched-chain amino acid transport system ATP-binding protein
VTLIGANGAGKSTTLRSINGLNHPRRGAIRFQGKDITNAAPHRIVASGISQSPEGRKLFPRMTVLENLEMGAFSAPTAEIGDKDRVYTLFPACTSACQKAGTMSGASSRCVRSAGR